MYMLKIDNPIPYLRISPENRVKVLEEELREGKQVWSVMTTKVDGAPKTIAVCKEWGVLLLGDRLFPLEQYPLISVESIETGVAENDSGEVDA
jgi:hypothetical protein